MILVTNCPHNNGVYTLIDRKEGTVIKSSYSCDGIARLKREYSGYRWYWGRVGLLCDRNLRLVTNASGSYSRLYVRYFAGDVGRYYAGLRANRSHLLSAVRQYARIWPNEQGGLCPIHGDFSLGNLIFNEDSILIIDWEHFHMDAAPWGFDLVNLLYESVYFSWLGRGSLHQGDVEVYFEIRRMIREILPNKSDFDCTLGSVLKFISSHVSIWGVLVNKLPVVQFSEQQKSVVGLLEH